MEKETKIAVVGLGYVGLPLAIEFAKKYPVLGFDINSERVRELQVGKDHTLEADTDALKAVIKAAKSGEGKGLSFSANPADLAQCNVYIVTVPTPIDAFNNPDLKPLLAASKMVGDYLAKGDVVIYESTVYPGCTEEDCVPVLEKASGLRFNRDFFCGYSPERINPGDKVNTLVKIQKVTSGSTPEIADFVDNLYRSIIEAGTFRASCIKVAEASKAIENAQRDVNISFMNELALIFDRMGIDTNDVIDAAGSKWNFLKYRPGLVGGHCIGVDPYYLVHKARSLGYHPEVISSGRRVNNSIAEHIANKVLKLMIGKGERIKGSRVLLLGISFKENCPDIRNTKVVDIYRELCEFGLEVDVYDPWADPEEVRREYGIDIIDRLDEKKEYQAIIVAVAHEQFKNIDFRKYHEQGCVIYDAKNIVDRRFVDGRL
ncbi:MAG: nucleotide sugar dehydrogenase [Prevotellaceae bacterium]|jgi:UDP-N-acetyl-D-galactosamine dehydrogenase|nr:nucleotide sugar dehydrogenase [Prevotellaceae bacterium]